MYKAFTCSLDYYQKSFGIVSKVQLTLKTLFAEILQIAYII